MAKLLGRCVSLLGKQLPRCRAIVYPVFQRFGTLSVFWGHMVEDTVPKHMRHHPLSHRCAPTYWYRHSYPSSLHPFTWLFIRSPPSIASAPALPATPSALPMAPTKNRRLRQYQRPGVRHDRDASTFPAATTMRNMRRGPGMVSNLDRQADWRRSVHDVRQHDDKRSMDPPGILNNEE